MSSFRDTPFHLLHNCAAVGDSLRLGIHQCYHFDNDTPCAAVGDSLRLGIHQCYHFDNDTPCVMDIVNQCYHFDNDTPCVMDIVNQRRRKFTGLKSTRKTKCT